MSRRRSNRTTRRDRESLSNIIITRARLFPHLVFGKTSVIDVSTDTNAPIDTASCTSRTGVAMSRRTTSTKPVDRQHTSVYSSTIRKRRRTRPTKADHESGMDSIASGAHLISHPGPTTTTPANTAASTVSSKANVSTDSANSPGTAVSAATASAPPI